MGHERHHATPGASARTGGFVVRPGEKVATDGTVVERTSAIDASMLTGEGVPVEVGPDDEVLGATVDAGAGLSCGPPRSLPALAPPAAARPALP